MNICIIGLGSIGQRHLRNIDFVLRDRGLAATFDVVEPRELDYLAPELRALVRSRYTKPEEIGAYDLIWITNPSQIHYETLETVKDRAKAVFVEKPAFTKPLDAAQLRPYLDEKKFYVACPMRHQRVFQWMADFVRAHRIYCAKAMCSSYLPEWRPGTDYRKTYAAQPGAGGVKLDLVHEFDYLFTLFGMPKESTLIEGKVSHLEIRSPDVVSFVAKYPDKTLELHLDYFGRVARRTIELYTEDDVVVCDFYRQRADFLKSGKTVDLNEERDDYCRREENYFLDFALKGIANINSIPYANAIIGFLCGNRCGDDSIFRFFDSSIESGVDPLIHSNNQIPKSLNQSNNRRIEESKNSSFSSLPSPLRHCATQPLRHLASQTCVRTSHNISLPMQ